MLRLEPEATVVRTAGGRVHAAMSTLLVLSAVGNSGKKGTIMVVHHTDCGLQTADEESIRRVLLESVKVPEASAGDLENDMGEGRARKILEGVNFGAYAR